MEEQKKSDKKPRFSLAWKALTIVISLLIIYTGYHVLWGLSESVPTTAAGLVEQTRSVMLEGVIFRNEEPISTKYQGNMLPYISNGEKASKDYVVASIYSKFLSDNINDKIDELEEKLEILNRSNVKGLVSVVDIEKLENDIDKLYTSLMLAVSNNENYKVKQIEKELTICLNQMKIYKGEVSNYNSEIEALKSEISAYYALFDGEKEDIVAYNGGYFYYHCDGYENILTYEKLDSLTVNSLMGLLDDTKKSPVVNSSYTCKFVYASIWKMASVCDEATVALLEEGKEYSITLFDVKERNLKVNLEKIGEIQDGKAVLVFSCDTMPEGFDYSRYQSFKLEISTLEGYRVPNEALVSVIDENTGEEIKGVYILNASKVYFRRVDVIVNSEGYCIVKTLDRSKENYYEYLNLNDLIILEPDGMFDGKTLNK